MHLYPYVLVDVIFKYKTDMMCFPRFTLSGFSEYERLGPLSTTPYVCRDAIPLGESCLHETCKYNILFSGAIAICTKQRAFHTRQNSQNSSRIFQHLLQAS
jgi:hypothetical protein